MNIEKDTWHIINSYFKSEPEYIAKHHIDSYNDFIVKKLPQIFKEQSKQLVYRNGIPADTKLRYSANIYIGGRDGTKFYIGKPTIYDHETKEMRILYPNEARLKNITYGCDVYYDVEVDYSLLDEDTNKYIYKNLKPPNIDFMKKKFLTRLPIMVHSNLCSLNNISEPMRQNLGEGKYDPGGYFIFDGKEKVIVCQERKVENKMFLKVSKVDRITHYVEVKSRSIDLIKLARSNRVQYENTNFITVRLGQSNAFLEEKNGRDIPLFIVFRLLGIESDKEILEFILQDLDTKSSTILMDMLRPSINDPFIIDEQVYDQASAINYCENIHKKIIKDKESKFTQIKRNKQLRLTLLYEVIYENFLPHIGNDFKEKAFYLSIMVRKLLLFKAGLLEETVIDNFNNKRIDLSGGLLSTGFKNAFREFNRKMQINIAVKYEFEPTEYSDENFANIINENTFDKIFSIEVFDNHFFKQLKKGNIESGPTAVKRGVIRLLERLSFFDDMSHIRRIVDPVEDLSTCALSRRRLHGTQYGCVCPLETPEGQRVGLQKGLAMLSLVTYGTNPINIINLLIKMGIMTLDEIKPTQLLNKTKIFVNGRFIGIVENPNKVVKLLKLLRRNNIKDYIHRYSSISFYREKNEIIINTDDGRFCFPLYIIENNKLLLQPKHIEKIKNGSYTWNDLIANKEVSKEDKNILDNIKIKNILKKTDTSYYKSLIETLERNQSVIEYIDSEELHNSLLSPKINIDKIEPHLQQLNYTHSELHPSMILGSSAFLVPYPEYNNSVRSVYSQKNSKKTIGTYSTAFNNRFDTSGNILTYPERPLITNRMAPIIHSDVIGTGTNVIIAITVYNGYNQEDAIIVNKKSLDMGLFNHSMMKMYTETEIDDPKTEQEEKFYNPLQIQENEELNEISMKNDKNYQKLDEFGFIKKGSYLEPNDIMIGKYMKYKNDKGHTEYKDMSKEVKKDNEGSIVDKVFCWNSNAAKLKVTKIRTIQYRKPQIGDKLTNRGAQKGVIGMILNPEDMPYTKDGIVPDLIVNPYAYTSRMTVAGLLEILNGMLGLEMGHISLGSPFEPINPEKIGDILEEKCGLTRYCDSVLYEGTKGKMMDTNIYTGPVYYQRLKQQVQDKLNARSGGRRTEDNIPEPGGAYTAIERQPVQGRANGGGMRLGEMERDSVLAHGISAFMKETTMERGDKFIIYISKKTHNMIIINPDNEFDQKVFFNPNEDGPILYHLTEGEEDGYSNKQDIIGLDTLYQSDTNFYKIEIPYCMKLLIQELAGMNMKMNIEIEDITIKLGELFKLQKLNSLKGSLEIKETQEIIKKHNKSTQIKEKQNEKQKQNEKKSKSTKNNKSMKGGSNHDLITELENTSENIKEPSDSQNENKSNMNEPKEDIKKVFIENNHSGGNNENNQMNINTEESKKLGEPNSNLKDIQNDFKAINIDELNNEITDNEIYDTEKMEKKSSNEFKIIDLENEANNDKRL